MFKFIVFNTLIHQNKIKDLAKTQFSTCVSLYIPTHRSGFDNNKVDTLTFRNALGEARIELEDWGIAPDELHNLLQPAYELLEEESFWHHLSDGFAVFISPDRFEYFELPISFNSFVYVGQEFYLRPLLPMFTGDGRFFLLALSQNKVRFFEGSRHSITPVKIEDVVPENRKEALALEELEIHLQGRTDQTQYGSTHYHGHGQNKDAKEIQIQKYFREVDDGLMTFLYDEKEPMILAAVDHLVPMYKALTRYPNVMDFHIKGNPDHDSPVLLHEKAWYKMAPYFKARQKEAFDKYEAALAQNSGSSSIEKIVPAAINGRIETLFVNKDHYNTWGFYDLTHNEIALQPKRARYSTCMLNLAAIQTFLQGGKVFNVSKDEMPDKTASMNAIFRY